MAAGSGHDPAFTATLFRCGGSTVFGRARGPIWSWFLVGSESDVRHYWPQVRDPIRPSLPRCFGVAGPTFWARERSNLELVSCRITKRR